MFLLCMAVYPLKGTHVVAVGDLFGSLGFSLDSQTCLGDLFGDSFLANESSYCTVQFLQAWVLLAGEGGGFGDVHKSTSSRATSASC